MSIKEYCKLIVWKTPENSRGQVTGYEIEFSNRGEQLGTVTVTKGSTDTYHVIQENDTFQEFRVSS